MVNALLHIRRAAHWARGALVCTPRLVSLSITVMVNEAYVPTDTHIHVHTRVVMLLYLVFP